MRRLHTARFFEVNVWQEHLALLFQSNSLHHLILSRCSLPGSVRLPQSHIRDLTLTVEDNCDHMRPLLGHCSANLEALDFALDLGQAPFFIMTLPLFRKLRKLQYTIASRSVRYFVRLASLAPKLEHLEVWVQRYLVHELPALPASLNHLRTNQWLIEDGFFGTRPFVYLRYLHITNYIHVVGNDHRSSVIPIIQCIFPNLTSLDVEIRHTPLATLSCCLHATSQT